MPPQRWSRVSFPLRNPESKWSETTKLTLTPDQRLKWRFPSTLRLKVKKQGLSFTGCGKGESNAMEQSRWLVFKYLKTNTFLI